MSTDKYKILQAAASPEDTIMAAEAIEGPTVVNYVASTVETVVKD